MMMTPVTNGLTKTSITCFIALRSYSTEFRWWTFAFASVDLPASPSESSGHLGELFVSFEIQCASSALYWSRWDGNRNAARIATFYEPSGAAAGGTPKQCSQDDR